MESTMDTGVSRHLATGSVLEHSNGINFEFSWSSQSVRIFELRGPKKPTLFLRSFGSSSEAPPILLIPFVFPQTNDFTIASNLPSRARHTYKAS